MSLREYSGLPSNSCPKQFDLHVHGLESGFPPLSVTVDDSIVT